MGCLVVLEFILSLQLGCPSELPLVAKGIVGGRVVVSKGGKGEVPVVWGFCRV